MRLHDLAGDEESQTDACRIVTCVVRVAAKCVEDDGLQTLGNWQRPPRVTARSLRTRQYIRWVRVATIGDSLARCDDPLLTPAGY